jgi:lipoprotein-anchoring transpeptidase ErfK/SrfK
MTNSKRRKSLVAASALLGGVLLLTACGGGDKKAEASDSKQSTLDAAAAKNTSAARIVITPKNGADNTGINKGTEVSVSAGKLTQVSMTDTAGKPVKGTLAADGRSWLPDGQLNRSSTYRISATAEDAKGRQAHENSSFSTVPPAHSFIGNFTPEDGSTVGVGMPVSINFDKAIINKKAVEDGIKVTSSSGQQVVGHWFSPTRLDLRPDQYWQEGSTVTMKLSLDGVEGAAGITGVQDKTVSFRIGRNQVSVVDAATKTMNVMQDGKTIKTIPISAGSPEHTTYNGQMVISEKYKQTRMDGSTVGFTNADGKGEYDIKDVPHAMRLSSSGTFIHGVYWHEKSIFGSVNTSHGCVGLFDTKGANDPNTPAAWFYNHSLIGDVVVVKNSQDKQIQPDNGLNGWNLDWSAWKAGSAA